MVKDFVMHNIFYSRQSTSQTSTSSTYGNTVQLKAVPANGHAKSEPPHIDIVIQPSTLLCAKHRGFGEHFVHLIKKIVLLALDGFEPGDIVDSTKLCAEIRYGLSNDKPVDGADVPGLSKGERLDAGTVFLILADAGELPLEPMGPNKANLQQYRVR